MDVYYNTVVHRIAANKLADDIIMHYLALLIMPEIIMFIGFILGCVWFNKINKVQYFADYIHMIFIMISRGILCSFISLQISSFLPIEVVPLYTLSTIVVLLFYLFSYY